MDSHIKNGTAHTLRSRDPHFDNNRLGHKACYFGHRQIIQKMLAQNESKILILEDDVDGENLSHYSFL